MTASFYPAITLLSMVLFYALLFGLLNVPSRIRRVFLSVLCLLSLIMIFNFILDISVKTLQVDFSTMYTAGEALNKGLDPYKNNVLSYPSVWDGANVVKRSSFLYPPLAARLFGIAALLPYAYAKLLWMILGMACVALTLIITGRVMDFKWSFESVTAVIFFTASFFPFLAFLERGQIDGMTMLLIFLAVYWMAKKGGTTALFFSGLLLAVATLLKLHCVYIAPFVILRRKWHVLNGFFVGCALLITLSFLTAGPDLFFDYMFRHVPVISRDRGLSSGPIQREAINLRYPGFRNGATVKGGITYRIISLDFIGNATLVRTPFGSRVAAILNKAGVNSTNGAVSSVIFFMFFIFVAAWQYLRRSDFSNPTAMQEVIYWQIAFIAVLLSGPFSWTMNTIWLLPVSLIVLRYNTPERKKPAAWALYSCMTGLALTALPDSYFSFFGNNAQYRYIVTEIIVMLSLLGMFGVDAERKKNTPA